MRRALAAAAAALAVLLPILPANATTAPAQVPRWNATQMDLTQTAIDAGNGGAGITVAVLDTWIDAAHPNFEGRVLPGADCVGGSCTAGNTTAPDGCEAHGTHVAGIVASSSYGVAPEATILPVRVLSGSSESTCVANSTDVANGVRWAAAHGARIINISLGTAYPVNGQITALAQAVDAVSAQGVLVIAAAGNQQAPVGSSYGSDAIVVAATGPSGALASYSQSGNGVSFAAPGGDPGNGSCSPSDCVVSTWQNGEYAALAGTSMSAPHVAGLAALLLGQNPQRSRASVLALMQSTAHPLAGAGSGLIDAADALGVGSPAASSSPTATAHPSTPVGTATPSSPSRASTPGGAAPVTSTPSQSTPSQSTLTSGTPAGAVPVGAAPTATVTVTRPPAQTATSRSPASQSTTPTAGRAHPTSATTPSRTPPPSGSSSAAPAGAPASTTPTASGQGAHGSGVLIALSLLAVLALAAPTGWFLARQRRRPPSGPAG